MEISAGQGTSPVRAIIYTTHGQEGSHAVSVAPDSFSVQQEDCVLCAVFLDNWPLVRSISYLNAPFLPIEEIFTLDPIYIFTEGSQYFLGLYLEWTFHNIPFTL